MRIHQKLLLLCDTNAHPHLLDLWLQQCPQCAGSLAATAHDMLVFAEELPLCAEGDGAIHTQGVCSQSGGGFLGMSTSHKNKNRSPPGLLF